LHDVVEDTPTTSDEVEQRFGPDVRQQEIAVAQLVIVALAVEDFAVRRHDRWVGADGVDGHHDTIKLRWEMLPASGGPVISIGFDFMVLGDDGRIRTGYQFIEA